MPPARIARSILRDVFLNLFLAEVGKPAAALPVARIYALWCTNGLRRSDLLETMENLIDAGLLQARDDSNDDLCMQLTTSGQLLQGGSNAMRQLSEQLNVLRRPQQTSKGYIELSPSRSGAEAV